MSSDIRKWFMKQHDKGSGTTSKPALVLPDKPTQVAAAKLVLVVQENPGRRTTSICSATSAYSEVDSKEKTTNEIAKTASKRKAENPAEEYDDVKLTPSKKIHKYEDTLVELNFIPSSGKKKADEAKPAKKFKNNNSKAITKGSNDTDEEEETNEKDAGVASKAGGRGRGGRGSGAAAGARGRDSHDEDEEEDETDVAAPKFGGRGRGGRGSGTAAGGRGRGGGRGGFMNFGERKDPPHKGEKEVPEGASECLAGLTFVISGTLDSLEREEAEDLIKRHGGRITTAISKKTNFLLADEDIGGRKSSKAKELGIRFLNEDGLFDIIRKSRSDKAPSQTNQKNEVTNKLQIKSIPNKVNDDQANTLHIKDTAKVARSSTSPSKQKVRVADQSSLPWTEKYRPKVPNDIIANQGIIKQLHDWLNQWNEQFLHGGMKGKGKRQTDSGFKKAVLLSGPPGIGKSTTAKLISQMLCFQAVEVNASDSRGKADSKIQKGISGSTSNSIKELVSNEALNTGKDWSKHPKSVLIMDEVDGMSAGDRGGVTDLIASIKISKIPIICICNDRYSQKLKSLINYCLPLNFRKPTKQQMAKRLKQIADVEGLQVNEITLEELAERVNGDMRMAVNQLQYMSLSQSVINYNDIRQRFVSSAKDEDISPFTAVDKLFGFNGGKLRMDERIDLSMSDPDLVPLIVQENYINYRPSSVGKDETGVKRMNFLARAAESIGDGDIINVQIRRYRQWQLSQAGSLAACIIPAAFMHGQRETLEVGERNFNRFGGWLGKNSTMGKNLRLLEDVRVHFLASQNAKLDGESLRMDYLTPLLKQFTSPLRMMPKDVGVQKVVEFMDTYSLSMEDFDTIVELSKFKGHQNPMDGIQPAVKAALTKAYKQGSSSRVVRAADLITLPGLKKAPRKRIAGILEPAETGLSEENGDALGEEEELSDSEETDELGNDDEAKSKLGLLSNKSKGIHVQLELKNDAPSNVKKASASKSRVSSSKEKGSSGVKPAGGKRKR